jgi:hypothetical protein
VARNDRRMRKLLVLSAALLMTAPAQAEHRPRAREAGIVIGVLPTGPLNAITDVAGVKVGQVTLIEGAHIRTGVTAILPHGGNLYQDKVPAAASGTFSVLVSRIGVSISPSSFTWVEPMNLP